MRTSEGVQDYIQTHPMNHSLSLLQTAKLAYELSIQAWADMNQSTKEIQSVEILTERILAIFLIRILALLFKKGLTPGLPTFSDLSTSTICHAILNYRSSGDHASAEGLMKADDSSHDHFEDKNKSLQWPEGITEEIISKLRQYISKILEGYHVVSYHNRGHAYHVFISAQKLLDMVLCECDYSRMVSNQPIKKSHRSTFGLKKDPLIQLAFLFSALVHDVDHKGVSNRQLVLECDELAIMYNDQSVAEQRSLAIAFGLLMNKDYEALRNIFFQGDDYTRFRKIVIDLVLCTDIANPERVQIIKSKWKEAFGDRHRTLAPKMEFPKMPVPGEVYSNCLRDSVRSSIGHDEAPTRRNGIFGSESEAPIRRTSIIRQAPDEFETPPARPEMNTKKSLTFSERKKRNKWKSEPANPYNRNVGEKMLLRNFFEGRASQLMMRRSNTNRATLEDENSTGSSVHEFILKKKKKKKMKLRLSKLSFIKKRKSRKRASSESKREENQEPDLKDELIENVAPLRSSATSPRRDSFRSSGNIESFKGLLDQYADDISESSGISNATSIYVPNHKDTRKAMRKSVSCATRQQRNLEHNEEKKVTSKHPKRPGCSRESSSNTSSSGSKFGSKRRSFKKMYRRFTEPAEFVDKKKFHFRLGIRRALDLTGNQIDAYQSISTRRLQSDPDKPDELKVIVVLEQLMKAADVAANMQDWDTMITWCKRLFHEQMTCFVEGRGEDPISEWHGNQIAFFESYTMPLACRLAETEVFEFAAVQELVNGVRQNNIRWMIEGMEVVKKMVDEWGVLQQNKGEVKGKL